MPLSASETKKIRSLHTKKGRRSAGRFLGEGTRLLEEAVQCGFLPERVYMTGSFAPDSDDPGNTGRAERNRRLAAALQRARVSISIVSAKDMTRIAQTTTPPGILGVFVAPAEDLAEHWHTDTRTILMCENINDPGNLGTLLRSARAFDFAPVVLTGNCAETYAPKTVRSAAGALFALPVVRTALPDLVAVAKQHGAAILAADSRGAEFSAKAMEACGDRPIILAIGSEADGLSDAVRDAADHVVRIPHNSSVESLNAAVAGSILMNEVYHYRMPVKL